MKIRMKRIESFGLLRILVVLPCCFFIAESALCQSKTEQEQHGNLKRLILKDGSYESINQYSIQGDRVRYFSMERHGWEELPYSLIDWPATGKYAKDAAQEVSKRQKELLEGASQERAVDEARYPTVAPGLRLPSPDGVFLLDIYQVQPELSQLSQVGADLKKHVGNNILRSVINPISGSRQTVELPGTHARIQSHVLTPVIYFSVDSNDPLAGYTIETAKDHLRIVRCQEKDGNRIAISLNIAVYGKVQQQTQYVEATVEPLSNYWVKITPSAPLQPGEYALVEVDDKGAVNEFVWDFGVDPAALPNPAMRRVNLGGNEPVLIKKPAKK
jgi:hypothetical protein